MQRIPFSAVLLVSLLATQSVTLAQRNRPANRSVVPARQPSAGSPRPDSARTSRLHVLARNYGDSVVLRWAPSQAAHFLSGSQTGYWVERTEISAQHPTGLRTRLSPTPVQPWTLAEGRQRIRPNNPADRLVAMGLQMLYGQGYTKTFTPDFSSIVNLSDEQNNRFSVALMAADYSARAASALGLRWVDRSPRQKDAIYLYQVFSANPKPGPSDLRDTAAVAVAPPDVFRPVAPVMEAVENGDSAITLIWQRRSTQGGYSGFYIERSTDGRQFQRLTETPYIQSKPDAAMLKRDTIRFQPGRNWSMLMAYTDSVKVNYRRFYYRVVGVDAFGDLSPASEVLTGMGRDLTPPPAPIRVQTEVIDNRRIRVRWSASGRTARDAAGYVVGRSASVNGPFTPISSGMLPPAALQFTDEKPLNYSNFYTVGAVDTAGNVAFAPAVVGIIADLLPPKAPAGLTAETDTNGVVRLTWPLGQDDDIVSYKVYRSYEQVNDFYRQLTPVGIAMTSYADTLPRPMLNEVVYYKLVAIDRTGNHSPLSQPLEVTVPDRMPPTAPVLKNAVVAATGITLEAIPSSSLDVTEHRLYRREGEGDWQLLRRLPGRGTTGMTLRDTTVRSGHTYAYALTAVDDAQLESAKSFPVPIQFTTNAAPAVGKVQARYDGTRQAVQVSWDFPTSHEPYHFVVYRSVNGSGLTMFRAVDSQQRTFQDTEVASSGQYAYALRVQYHEHGSSRLSEVAQVTK